MPPDLPGSPATPYSSAIDLGRFSWATALTRDYCGAYERLAAFYAGAPDAPACWRDALEARQSSAPDTTAVAQILASQLRSRGAPREAREAAGRLAEAGTVAILTGQQAGLFGGPLYTMFKALTAIALARQVESTHGVQAVPVFWIDAEDHDVDEVRSCSVLDADLDLRRISLELPTNAGCPVSSLRLPESTGATLDALREALPPTEFTDALIDTLSGAYTTGRGMVDAFARWLEANLGARGLVVFDASDPAAKPLVRSVFEHELRSRGDTSRLAAGVGEQLVAQGYHAQVTPTDDAVALFELNDTRRAIRLSGDGFAVATAERETVRPQDELLDQVRDHPETFSPNVLLRPIVQDTLFPTVAYVTGPNELAYLGQLRPVYERFGVPMPLLYPRLSATLLDRASTKFLARHELDFEGLQPQDDGVLNQLVSAQLPSEVDTALTSAERQVTETLAAIANIVPAVDPTLVGATNTTRDRMDRDLRTLRGKIVQAAKRRDETLRRQFGRARAQAFPGGAPQERAIGFVYFLNRYGPRLVDHLLDDLPLDIGPHWLVTV